MKSVLELNLTVTNMGEYNRVLQEVNGVEGLPDVAESKLYKDKIEEVTQFALCYYHSRVVFNGYDGGAEIPNMKMNYYLIKRNFSSIPEK